jgi:hypothetical protein
MKPLLELPAISFYPCATSAVAAWNVYVDGRFCRPLDAVMLDDLTIVKVNELVDLFLQQPDLPEIARNRARLWQQTNGQHITARSQ